MNIQPNLKGRQFQVWRYNVSHRQLLLRSTKSSVHVTRMDILFKNVLALKLCTVMNDIEIREAAGDEKYSIGVEHRLDPYNGTRFFILGDNVSAYVVASSMDWLEDDGEYDQESYLFSNL